MSETYSDPVLSMQLEQVFTNSDQAFKGKEAVSRDLGLGKATGDVFLGRRVRLGDDAAIAPVATNASAWFTFVYIIAGEVTVNTDDGMITLKPHDAATEVPLTAETVVSASPNLEFLEVQASDTDATRKVLPNRPHRTISYDNPEAHELGTGPRSFFDYRNLGVADATDRLIEVQVVRAQRAREGGTGWHSHDMAQLTYGLKGWGKLQVEGVMDRFHRPGDGFSIPAHVRHNACAFSDDYWALQLQIPADYRTFVREAPESV